MRLNAVATIAGLAAVSLFVSSNAAAQANWSNIVISRWVNIGGGGGSTADYSEANADTTFSIANSDMVTDNDGSGYDVGCGQQFARNGSVWWLYGSGSDGDISSSSEFFYVNSGGTFMKVVPWISWCGAPGTWAGCAVKGGLNSLIVPSWAVTGSARGAVFNHEYGHVTGLDHVTNTANIMNASVGAGNNRVTPGASGQCPFFRSPYVDPDGPGSSSGSMSPAETTDYSQISIEELAHMPIVDTMPVDAEDYYGDSDIEKLRMMLADPNEAEHWQTIVTLLGLLSDGADADAAAISSFVDSQRTSLVARAGVLALGYVAERGNMRALGLLRKEAHDPRSSLANSALLGLGLSGHASVAQELNELRKNAVKGDARPQLMAPGQTDRVEPDAVRLEMATIDEAVKTANVVGTRGRRALYGR